MPNRRRDPKRTLSAMLPKIRVYPEEYKRIQTLANQQGRSFSEFLRLTLLSVLPQPVLLPKKNGQVSSETQESSENKTNETDSRAPVSEKTLRVPAGKRCIHGHRVICGATDCFQCSNMGIVYES